MSEAMEPRVGEVLAALSRALDLVEGQPAGHAVRTAMIAMRLADDLGLSESQRESLFYAALLKDSGCSNNAARMHMAFGGDELVTKRDVKLVDWSDPLRMAMFGVAYAERGGSFVQRLRKLVHLAKHGAEAQEAVFEARCTRGADIVRRLGFGEEAAEAVHHLDEHWDGGGLPGRLKGDATPILARILGLAQTLEVFASVQGIGEGVEMVRERTGRWFDPEIAQAAIHLGNDRAFWADHASHLLGETLPLPIDPSTLNRQATSLDVVCQAFAEIIDAKSTFTGEHSTRVTGYALALGVWFGFDQVRLGTLRRAALLHDVGKLGVPNAILDKPDRLTDEEFGRVKLHPRFTYDILTAIPGFDRVTEIASAHHERLDGRGYWRGLQGDALDLDMRILTAADVFDALSAERPYRGALPHSEVMAIMRRDSGTAFDPDCVDALDRIYGRTSLVMAS